MARAVATAYAPSVTAKASVAGHAAAMVFAASVMAQGKCSMAKITTVCCDCGKNLGSYSDSSLSEDMTSHGYCDKCADKRRKELDDYKKRR